MTLKLKNEKRLLKVFLYIFKPVFAPLFCTQTEPEGEEPQGL